MLAESSFLEGKRCVGCILWIMHLEWQSEVIKMDANKFGCFGAERRKELNMTQKDLATKIQVTDKAVSKWERGLGLPDINTIEDLANALGVSITELMKSERKNESVSAEETVVNDVLQVAKADMEERHKIITYTFAGTTVLLTVLEILMSINWNAAGLALSANVPWTARERLWKIIIRTCREICTSTTVSKNMLGY